MEWDFENIELTEQSKKELKSIGNVMNSSEVDEILNALAVRKVSSGTIMLPLMYLTNNKKQDEAIMAANRSGWTVEWDK